MAWLQSPIFLVIMLIILIALIIVYSMLRSRKKTRSSIKPSKEAANKAVTATEPVAPSPPPAPVAIPVMENVPAKEQPITENPLDQIISPDVNLIPDVLLKPGDETVLLILPEHVPVDEVKKFEGYLKKLESLKIVTTGGSSDEGSNIGVRILNPVNLTELLANSNMSIIKHVRKKGERVVLSLKI